MAVTYVKDLYKGTFYQSGIFNTSLSRARIAGLVEFTGEHVDSRGALPSAANAALAQYGLVHPNNIFLRARSIRAEQIGPSHAKVSVNYWKTSADRAVSTNLDLAHIDATRTMRVRDYSEPGAVFTGDPGSTTAIHRVSATNGDIRIAPRIEERPFLHVSVFVQLANSPLNANVRAMLGKLNANPFNIGGHEWAPWEVRFDGPETRVIGSGSGTSIQYLTVYHYQIMPGGFYTTRPVDIRTTTQTQGSGEITVNHGIVEKQPMAEAVTFSVPPLV